MSFLNSKSEVSPFPRVSAPWVFVWGRSAIAYGKSLGICLAGIREEESEFFDSQGGPKGVLEELNFVVVPYRNCIISPCEFGRLQNLLHQTPVPITWIYEDLSLHFLEAHFCALWLPRNTWKHCWSVYTRVLSFLLKWISKKKNAKPQHNYFLHLIKSCDFRETDSWCLNARSW